MFSSPSAAFPYLGLIFIPLFTLYYTAACFYRSTSREVKRVDSTVSLSLPGSPSRLSETTKLTTLLDCFLR